MGRPREHDEATAAALLSAAERIVERGGLRALSVRRVATEAGTTNRAVYSLFGSKDGLVVALGAHSFGLLEQRVRELAITDDPILDLVDAGLHGFRPFALEHPSLFVLAVQKYDVPPEVAARFRRAADSAMQQLLTRLRRLESAGLLAGRDIHDAAMHFHALCEGLAGLELRGVITPDRAERAWHDGLSALTAGFAASPPDTDPT